MIIKPRLSATLVSSCHERKCHIPDVARRRTDVEHMRPRGLPLAMTMKNDGHAFMSMEATPAGLKGSGSSAIIMGRSARSKSLKTQYIVSRPPSRAHVGSPWKKMEGTCTSLNIRQSSHTGFEICSSLIISISVSLSPSSDKPGRNVWDTKHLLYENVKIFSTPTISLLLICIYLVSIHSSFLDRSHLQYFVPCSYIQSRLYLARSSLYLYCALPVLRSCTPPPPPPPHHNYLRIHTWFIHDKKHQLQNRLKN